MVVKLIMKNIVVVGKLVVRKRYQPQPIHSLLKAQFFGGQCSAFAHSFTNL